MKLENNVDILSGYAFKSKLFNTEGNGIPIIRIRDVTSNSVSTYYDGDYKDEFVVCDGDLLVGMDGQFSLIEWHGGKALLNQRVCKITPKKDKIEKGFLKYLVPKSLKEIEDKTSFATVKHLTVNKIKEITLPPTSLEIQKKIAQTLDDAAALRNKTEQLIKEYDVLAQSIFLDMFGDPIKNPKGWKLEKLISLSPIVKKTISPENILSDTKYVGLDSIEKNTGNINEIQKVEKGELKSNKYIFSDKNILYGKLRPYLNKVANPNFSGICSTDIIVFLPNNSMSNKQFITTFLSGKWFVEWANLNTSGANLPRLDLSMLSKYKIICPPIELQNLFAEKITLIEKQKELAKQELKESEDLFNCLLQKAFKGELV